MAIYFQKGRWINPPSKFLVLPERVEIVTEPRTDFWQRSYYGFRNDNAPALLVEVQDNFTFTVKTRFDYQARFDQCGLIIYLDSDNWFKASIEYEHQKFSRLGSVVTNLGYSDWATTDIATPDCIWYRLSRRGPDFLIETSCDGERYRQMRIFHLHALGATTQEMGLADPPLSATLPVQVGLYACSPQESSFKATFEQFCCEPCVWPAHRG